MSNLNAEIVKEIKCKCLDFYVTAFEEMTKRLPFNDIVFRGLKFLHADLALRDAGRCVVKDINEIAKYFGTFDVTALAFEWRILPTVFSDAEKDFLATLDIDDMWGKILDKKNFNDERMFPNLQHLVDAVLSLPHSNAEAERLFSIVTDVKDKNRNRFNIETINSICKTRSKFQAENIDCRKFQVDSRHFELHTSSNLYSTDNK